MTVTVLTPPFSRPLREYNVHYNFGDPEDTGAETSWPMADAAVAKSTTVTGTKVLDLRGAWAVRLVVDHNRSGSLSTNLTVGLYSCQKDGSLISDTPRGFVNVGAAKKDDAIIEGGLGYALLKAVNDDSVNDTVVSVNVEADYG